MSKRDFDNRLRILRSLDQHEISHLTESEWSKFQLRPEHFYLRADDPTADGIWDAIEKRAAK